MGRVIQIKKYNKIRSEMVPFSGSEQGGEPTTLGTEGKNHPERIAVGNWCLLKNFGLWSRHAAHQRLPAKREPGEQEF